MKPTVSATRTYLPSPNYTRRRVGSSVANGWSAANGAAVDQWSYSGGANQQWVVIPVRPGVYNLKNVNSGQLLDASGAKTANGTQLDQYPSNDGTNQQWKFQ